MLLLRVSSRCDVSRVAITCHRYRWFRRTVRPVSRWKCHIAVRNSRLDHLQRNRPNDDEKTSTSWAISTVAWFVVDGHGTSVHRSALRHTRREHRCRPINWDLTSNTIDSTSGLDMRITRRESLSWCDDVVDSAAIVIDVWSCLCSPVSIHQCCCAFIGCYTTFYIVYIQRDSSRSVSCDYNDAVRFSRFCRCHLSFGCA